MEAELWSAEAVAQAEPEAVSQAEPEAVAQAEPEAVAEPTSEPESQALEARAESDQTSVAADDIWYSGAPDAEIPSAELVGNEPVGVAAAGDRSDGFVWIPADDERD
jgi:hypothetical protein